jgi:uncharacterized protein (TIGR03067 family)
MLVLTVGVALAAAGARADDKAGSGRLDGTWVATSWKRGNAEVGKDQVATELVLTKNSYEFPKGINRISKSGSVKVDAAKGTIDFIPDDGPAKGKTLQGIYKIEGDTLTICFTVTGKERPAELKTGDRTTVLATYERKKK